MSGVSRGKSTIGILGVRAEISGWQMRRVTDKLKLRRYCSFAYSALASFRMGMSGSASFQSVRKSL